MLKIATLLPIPSPRVSRMAAVNQRADKVAPLTSLGD